MANRRATVSQADVKRTVLALKAAGLTIARALVTPEGVALETGDGERRDVPRQPERPKKKWAL